MEPVEYSATLWKALEKTFSKGRLQYYLRKAKHDERKAFELHRWNTRLSESLYVPLQAFEITLRNALDNQISKYHRVEFATEEWYIRHGTEDWLATFCVPRGKRPCPKAEWDLIEGAKKNLPRPEKRLTHDNFVAATSFRLWVNFLDEQYDGLWKEVLCSAFPQPGRPARRDLHSLARQANWVRNRVAHYEPIVVKEYGRDLELDKLYEQVLAFLKSLSRESGVWVSKSNRFGEVWADRPHWW